MVRPVPKPLPRPKAPRKPLPQGKPLNRGKGLSRGKPMRKGPAKRIAKETPREKRYKSWIHTQPCVGEAAFRSHCCADSRSWNPIEQSHERNMTGMGLKSNNLRSVAMCLRLHQQWEQHRINFAGWTKEERRDWMAARISEANAKFDAEQAVASSPGARR